MAGRSCLEIQNSILQKKNRFFWLFFASRAWAFLAMASFLSSPPPPTFQLSWAPHPHSCLCCNDITEPVLLLCCGNPTKYIYRLHKWKATVPVCPQKMRMGCIFQQLVHFFIFYFCTLTRRYLCNFFRDELAARSLTSHWNCHRKSWHFLLSAWRA